jgi:hypothetical protein
MKVKSLFTCLAVILLTVVSVCSCDNYLGIDDDLDDCGYNYNITYRLNLITNMDEEIDYVLYAPADAYVKEALRTEWGKIFREYGNDLNLSFYHGAQNDRAFEETHQMNAREASYTIYLEEKTYRNLAIANVGQDPAVESDNMDNATTATLQTAGGEAMQSHTAGIFTGRADLNATAQDNDFLVNLYIANSAAAIVVDTTGYDVKDIRIAIDDMAESFNANDSTYNHTARKYVVGKQLAVDNPDNKRVCLYGVCFPSPDRMLGSSELWHMRVYVTLANGSVTENVLSIHTPLKAGFTKILKSNITENGVLEMVDTQVGVSFTLDWKEGGSYNPGL